MANNYSHVGSGGGVCGGSADDSALKPNYSEICRDLVFFLNHSRNSINPEEKKSFARAAIIYLGFYFESLSNLLFDDSKILASEFESLTNSNKDLPIPIIKFLSSLNKLNPETLLECKGIRDLFLIRNHIFAHPPGRSIVSGTGVDSKKGLKSNRKKVRYNKFKDFPNIYSQFDLEHAESLCEEVDDFLKKFSIPFALNSYNP